VQGNITAEQVDAIVNAANSHLQHGGGLAAAICRKGGPSIQRESNAIGFVPTGGAAATGAGDLPCRYVIHAVGPVWGTGDEDAKLRSAVLSALSEAERLHAQTVSLPAISSGIFGFPKDRCARVILSAVRDYLEAHAETVLSEVRLCLYDEPSVQAFVAAWTEAGLDSAQEE
jgi:O-acetyl-ADP-ribose deacetylase (regulator of RNase III)